MFILWKIFVVDIIYKLHEIQSCVTISIGYFIEYLVTEIN